MRNINTHEQKNWRWCHDKVVCASHHYINKPPFIEYLPFTKQHLHRQQCTSWRDCWNHSCSKSVQIYTFKSFQRSARNTGQTRKIELLVQFIRIIKLYKYIRSFTHVAKKWNK